MYKEKIHISEEEVFFVEKYWFELQSLKDLVVQFMSNSELTVNEDKFEKVLKEYVEAYICYNIAFNKIVNKYVDYTHGKNIFIDFDKMCIIVQ